MSNSWLRDLGLPEDPTPRVIKGRSYPHRAADIVAPAHPLRRKDDLCKNGCGKPRHNYRTRKLLVCLDCHNETRKEYMRKWREDNA